MWKYKFKMASLIIRAGTGNLAFLEKLWTWQKPVCMCILKDLLNIFAHRYRSKDNKENGMKNDTEAPGQGGLISEAKFEQLMT